MATNYPWGLVSRQRTWSYASGWQAEEVFCIPFKLPGAAVFTITGTGNVDGNYNGVDSFIESNYAVFFPGSDLLQVTQIKDEPWMDGDVVLVDGMSNTRKVTFSYSIVYLDVSWPSNINRPNYKSGTTLKLKTKYAGQYMTIPAPAIEKLTKEPTPSPNTQATMFISLNEYDLEWDRVQDLADLDFDALIGCVNDADFFASGDKGTLLCEGAPQENTTVLNPNDPMAWKTNVTIKQRKIVVVDGDNAGTYGWNDWYNPKTKKWEALKLNNGYPPYDTTSFAGMFS